MGNEFDPGKDMELASKLLNLDRGVIATLISTSTGEILAQDFARFGNDSGPRFPEIPLEKSPIPALISSIFREGERYFGKPDYTVAVYEGMTLALVPSHTRGIVAALALRPGSDFISLAARTRKLLD